MLKIYPTPLRRILLLTALLLLGMKPSYAQNIEEVLAFRKKTPLKISGSISARATLFSSQPSEARQSFTYQLTGSVNLSLYELLNIPLSFNLNNYGANFSYPSLPNRLSLHPSYKWVKAHIGDVSMSFGPYTLNGHQFTGLGVELSPGRWQVSAMAGRLLKRVDADPNIPSLQVGYERWGYGLKTRYEGSTFALGGTVFAARDRDGRISFDLDALGIYPKGNIALGLEGSLSLIKDLKLSLEYGLSRMQQDLRSTEVSYYHALKADVSYSFVGNTLGVGYERIDPGYATLGAYYFNNDYENLTLNYSRSFFDSKLSLALSGGLQRDDLMGQKQEHNKRFVGSAQVGFTPSEALSASVSLSSFQSYRNLKSSFDYINARTPYDNLDTLQFTQLSHSLDADISWRLKQSEAQTQTLSATLSYQEAADRQGRYIQPGQLTRFMNLGTSYSLDLSALDLTLTGGFNVSNNYADRKAVLTLGPSLSLAKRFLKKQLSTGLSLSYNETQEAGHRLAQVYNLRATAGYRFWGKHGLNASVAYQGRKLLHAVSSPRSSFTSELSYSYSF
ncbi:hypothetical protein [uncultured Porphyromonas sp.]|uniref:hypothetical protein n=1 Tax=uncultured Porphyromonas sp. TaxID=159274 RepID=UPI002634E44A|nr:hypothetical protein [uncultured Porphyromonas sp.]